MVSRVASSNQFSGTLSGSGSFGTRSGLINGGFYGPVAGEPPAALALPDRSISLPVFSPESKCRRRNKKPAGGPPRQAFCSSRRAETSGQISGPGWNRNVCAGIRPVSRCRIRGNHFRGRRHRIGLVVRRHIGARVGTGTARGVRMISAIAVPVCGFPERLRARNAGATTRVRMRRLRRRNSGRSNRCRLRAGRRQARHPLGQCCRYRTGQNSLAECNCVGQTPHFFRGSKCLSELRASYSARCACALRTPRYIAQVSARG